MTEETEPKIVPLTYQRPPEGKSSGFGRYKDDPVQVVAREQVAFEVDSPTGKVGVTYGWVESHGYGPSDSLTARFRSEDIRGAHLRPRAQISRDSVIGRIGSAEAEFQTKKARDDARKEAAKNPIPCVLVVADKQSGRALRDAAVRGIDLRSNGALVVFPDGTKATYPAKMVLRELDRDERLEITRAFEDAEQANAEAAKFSPPRPSTVLTQRGIKIDLVVHYDPERDQRWTEVGDTTYWGDSDADLIEKITRDLIVADGEFKYATRGYRGGLGLIEDMEALDPLADLYRDEQEREEEVAAKEAADRARKRADTVYEDYLFDLSLFSGVAETPKPEQDAEQAVEVAPVQAPDYEPEWED